MMPGSVASGVAGVEARIAQIQARIEELTTSSRLDASAYLAAQETAEEALAPASATRPPAVAASQVSAGAPLPSWSAELPDAARRWIPAIERAATEAGVDPTLLAALVRHESNFDPSVVSHAGAIGLGQLMPGTAEWLGVDPHDPEQNLAGAATYLREQLDRFGSPDLALAAYNAGPNRVTQAGGIPRITETQLYVERVMSTWEQLR